MSTSQVDYLIVGAGVFGASTALHLSKQKPSASILLIDRTPFPCPIAASHDINKAVRADYTDIFYCKLGIQTLERWKNDPLFAKYFHQSGMITIKTDVESLGRRIIDNFKELNVHYEAEVFDPVEMKTRFDCLFASGDFSHTGEVYHNPLSGWAEAARALEATTQTAVDNGVRYVAASISTLLMDAGRCTGVRTTDGQIFTANHVILSTGANTAKLHADSAPKNPELQVGHRMTAAAVCESATNMNEEQRKKYKSMPVFVFDDDFTQGETMPITPDGQLKFIRDVPWKNTVRHHESGQAISIPPTTASESQWTAPETFPAGLREEISIVVKGIFGAEEEALQLTPNSFRMCWDALTPDNNFYITPHPRIPHLFIATGGSFHGWKFLPVLGEYVVRMLDGELSAEKRGRWAWDRKCECGGLYPTPNPLEPRRELAEILGGGRGERVRFIWGVGPSPWGFIVLFGKGWGSEGGRNGEKR
ncbi:MAG: hypothetical protein Q9216_005797 [Gyalolechia sp. 2 TL-2023]